MGFFDKLKKIVSKDTFEDKKEKDLYDKGFEKTRKESFKYSVINGLRNTAGFILACVIIGGVREILAFGTLGGFEITSVSLLPMAQTGFGGFLIIGVISALWHSMVEKRHAKFLNGTKGAR